MFPDLVSGPVPCRLKATPNTAKVTLDISPLNEKWLCVLGIINTEAPLKVISMASPLAITVTVSGAKMVTKPAAFNCFAILTSTQPGVETGTATSFSKAIVGKEGVVPELVGSKPHNRINAASPLAIWLTKLASSLKTVIHLASSWFLFSISA